MIEQPTRLFERSEQTQNLLRRDPQWYGPAYVVRQRRASGRLAHHRALFHKAKGPAPSHSIESVDNLISIEDRDEPVHCMRGVSWAWRDVFSEDAPSILHSSQYSLLIRVVHGARLLSADSIR